jgi:hypothetical protein
MKSLLAPIFGIVAGIAIIFFMVLAWVGATGDKVKPQRLVILDAVRLVNAQRAAIPALAKQGNGDPTLGMLQIGRQIEPTIKEIAGPGVIVVLKQAVVYDGGAEDITDRVLEKLGLPTNVPTMDLSSYLDIAPTTASGDYATRASVDEVVKRLQERNAKAAAQAREEEANRVLP